MAYKWKPSASQRKAFAQRMQDPTEKEAYEARKREKALYDNWKDKDFVPTKEQYEYAMQHVHKINNHEHETAFNQVMYGFTCNEKVNHAYIHVVNQYRRGELTFNTKIEA